MSANTDGLIDSVSVNDPVTPQERDRFPELPAQQADYLQNAPAFDDQDYSESQVFNALYDEAAMAYYPQATDVKARGRQVLRVFSKYKPLASSFVRSALRGDQVDDDLSANIDFEPEGSTEAIVRPLGTWSFSSLSDYSFTPSAEGQYNFIDGDTATAGEQAWFIFGYIDYNSGAVVPYDYAQSEIDDSLGVRRPFQLRNQMAGPDTMSVADRDRGPLAVFPGRTLNLDLNVTDTGIQSGLFPVGIEVLVSTASEYGGVRD